MMKGMIAAVLVASSAAGLAQTTAPVTMTDVAVPPVKAKPPKPICRSESVTGTHLSTQTCHSKEEWTLIDAQNAANAKRMSYLRDGAGRTR
jgi:hypothetical protein